MLRFTPSQLQRAADDSRQAVVLAAWDATAVRSVASYFYGYWFSHWRA
ncbi:hypothetical protein [Pseudomonas sp. LS-2]|jgi:hypothetical protein|nr:hypothetical protein [Pseudomonas sp. LS-2]